MSVDKPVRRVIVHAGLPKTATTTIQNACFAERLRLMDVYRILYPGQEANHTNALCTAFLENPALHISNKMAGRTDPKELAEYSASIRERLEAEIREVAPDTVLFSAEGLSNLNAKELGHFNDWLLGFAETVSVFYVLRSPVSYTTSVIQQHLKGGEVLEDMYRDLPLPSFKGRLSAALRGFGEGNVRVFGFEALCNHPQGILGAFLDILSVDHGTTREAVLKAQKRENESLSHEAALLLSAINRQRPAFVDGRRGPRRAFQELGPLQTIRGAKFHLPREVEAQVIEQSRQDLDWLKARFNFSDYDELSLSSHDRQTETLPTATIDTLALVLSNLINDRHVNSLTNHARELLAQKKTDDLPRLAEEILRITPDRPLPRFLAKAVADMEKPG